MKWNKPDTYEVVQNISVRKDKLYVFLINSINFNLLKNKSSIITLYVLGRALTCNYAYGYTGRGV